MAMFKAFKPAGMEKIARSMGYQGNMQGFQDYLAQDPMRQQQMQGYQQKAMQMAKGGMVRKMQTGGIMQAPGSVRQTTLGARGGGPYNNAPSMSSMMMSPQQQQEARDFVAAGGVPQMMTNVGGQREGGPQSAQQQEEASNVPSGQPLSGRQQPLGLISGNITGNLADAYDPRGIQPVTQPAANTGTVAPGFPPGGPQSVVGDGLLFPQGQLPAQRLPTQLGQRQPIGMSQIVPEFIPDASKVKPEDQLQTEWKRLQESARKARAEGFLGQVVLPGEGRYEDWKQMNQYELMRNPNFTPKTMDTNYGQPLMSADGTLGTMNTQQPDYSGMTYEQAQMRQSQRDVKSPAEAAAIQAALARGPSTAQQTAPPATTQLPQQPTDPYQQYRGNVDRFSETGTFKNPNIQPKFDAMTEALNQDDSNDPLGTNKTQAITDYVKTIYTGPITKGEAGFTGLGANEITPEFEQFARDVGIIIDKSATADGPAKFLLAEGSPIATIPGYLPARPKEPTIGDATTQRMFNPALPQGGVTQAAMTPTGPGQEIAPGTGALTGAVAVPTAMAQTATATPQQESQANVMEAATAAPAVDAAMNATQAAQATVDPRAQVTAAQQTATSVGNLSAAQGNATLIDNPVQRQIQSGELISGVADAQTAATFTEQVQAAEATPSTQATVQGQLASLTANFDAANPPAWAAGAMRNATAQMAARGLGASSLAGQAIVQATLESALPIAQADAATVAQFEAQNLSNRQQRAILSAQQRATFMGMEFDQAFQARVQNSARIADIANMNFTAEQQVQLENSRAANTMNLNNLSNSQAMVMAEASALAQMDAANLNNRQQAAVNNAQAFLQTDMANLSNQQQTELFKAQQRTQAMFTDQAATNAARQFNATSQNQVDQFFTNLAQQTSQFNATQQNAQAQFNAGQANTVERFNAEMNNQRDQFNAQNQIVIAQSNAQWRRQIATADTAAVNRANEINAAAVLDISKTAYDNLWSYYADSMEYAWKAADNELDRMNNLAIAQLSAEATTAAAAAQRSSASGTALGKLVGTLGSAWIGTW